VKGFNSCTPMGWDAFGLPAEQYAIQTGRASPGHDPPASPSTPSAGSLQRFGFSYDWSREIGTTDPEVLPLDAVDLPSSSTTPGSTRRPRPGVPGREEAAAQRPVAELIAQLGLGDLPSGRMATWCTSARRP